MNARNAPWCHWNGDYLILNLRVQPKACQNEITGPQGDHLKLRIAASAAGGKANQELVRFLAKLFGVPQKRVTLLRGITSRVKQVRIDCPQRIPSAFPTRVED